jgi:threonylcarbamoyladenosine tRNA methylthiotransferase MtaB
MPQTARAVVKERARRLREKGAAALSRHLDTQVGRTRRVLAESAWLGRSEHFTLVGLNAVVEPGMVVDVTIKGHDGRQLLAA